MSCHDFFVNYIDLFIEKNSNMTIILSYSYDFFYQSYYDSNSIQIGLTHLMVIIFTCETHLFAVVWNARHGIFY